MENLEKIQEIGTTEKAWIEYAQAIDRNNENIRIALDGIIRKEVLQSTMKRIAIYVPFPNMKLPIFLKVQCASPKVAEYEGQSFVPAKTVTASTESQSTDFNNSIIAVLSLFLSSFK